MIENFVTKKNNQRHSLDSKQVKGKMYRLTERL